MFTCKNDEDMEEEMLRPAERALQTFAKMCLEIIMIDVLVQSYRYP